MAECVKVSRSEIRMGVHSVILTHKKNTPCYFTTSHNILHSGNTEWWWCKVINPEVGAEGGMMKLVYDTHVSEVLDFNAFGANLLVQGDAKTQPLVYRTKGSSKNTVVREVHHAGLRAFLSGFLQTALVTKYIGSRTRHWVTDTATDHGRAVNGAVAKVGNEVSVAVERTPLCGIHPLHVLVDIGTCESMREHHSCHKMAIFQCNE